MTRFPLAYAHWEVRDYFRGPGTILIAIAALAAVILVRLPAAAVFESEDTIATIAGQSLFPLCLIVTAGMVSRDLAEGWYRAYFSRPVAPSFFYLQRWLLGGIVFLLYIPLLAAAVAIRTGEFVVPGWIVGRAALLYLLVGGTVFLFSTLTRRDWVVAALLFIVYSVLHGLLSKGVPLGSLARTIHAVLPPYHAGSLDSQLSSGDIRGALVYGVAMVLAAMAVLTWRPMGSGGRA